MNSKIIVKFVGTKPTPTWFFNRMAVNLQSYFLPIIINFLHEKKDSQHY